MTLPRNCRARIHRHGLTAELMTTPHGRAWGISSPENGFEEFASKQPNGTWACYNDLDAIRRNATCADGFPTLDLIMESIAMRNRAWAENRRAA